MSDLRCKNSQISAKQWMQCLLRIDKHVMDSYDDANNVIIISLPYKLGDIKQALDTFITNQFVEQSMLFCCDAIMEFITPNKQYIQNIMKSSESIYYYYGNASSKWSNEKYDELISTQSLIIINTQNGTFVSLPRNSNSFHSKWIISWWRWCGKCNKICDDIFGKVANEYLPAKFICRQSNGRTKGICKRFNTEKAYGFITRIDGGGDIFVHYTEIKADGFKYNKTLYEGEELEFDVLVNDSGLRRAINVTGPGGAYVKGNRNKRFRW